MRSLPVLDKTLPTCMPQPAISQWFPLNVETRLDFLGRHAGATYEENSTTFPLRGLNRSNDHDFVFRIVTWFWAMQCRSFHHHQDGREVETVGGVISGPPDYCVITRSIGHWCLLQQHKHDEISQTRTLGDVGLLSHVILYLFVFWLQELCIHLKDVYNFKQQKTWKVCSLGSFLAM